MLSIIVFLILGLNLILGEDIDLRTFRQDAQDALRIGQGPWQGPGGPWGKPSGWGKPPGGGKPPGWGGKPPGPEPTKSDGGVLGIDKLIGNRFPTPASSPITLVNVTFYDHDVCSSKSVISDLLFDGNFQFPNTCNGITTHVFPFFLNITINGQLHKMDIPKLYKNMVWLNGNTFEVVTGAISSPPQCAGPTSHYWDVMLFVAKDQYACVTTGMTGFNMVYSIKLITGPCQSVCWIEKGWITLTPPYNNLGAVTDLGNN